MFFPVLLVLLYICGYTVEQQAPDATKICQSAAECYGKLTDKSSECNKLSAAANAAQPQPKNPSAFQVCNAQARSISDSITAKAADVRREHATCLQSRIASVQPVNVNAYDRCNLALNNYQNPAPITLPSTPPVANLKNNTATAGQQDLHLCRAQEFALSAACAKLAGCCSENYICSLQVESSQDQLSMNKLKIDAELKRRECSKLKPPPRVASVAPNPAPKVGVVTTNPAPNPTPVGGPMNANAGGPMASVSAIPPSQ